MLITAQAHDIKRQMTGGGVTGHSGIAGIIMKIVSFHLPEVKNLKVTPRFLLENMGNPASNDK
jgi:hypothetical protein